MTAPPTVHGADPYDRAMGALDGLPDGAKAGPSIVRVTTPIVGDVETWVVTLVRHGDDHTAFVEMISARTNVRLVLPAKVVATLLRQHAAIGDRVRSRAARRAAEARKAAGHKPGFQMTPAERKAAKARKASK